MKAWISDKGKSYSGKRYRVVWISPVTRTETSRSFALKRDAEEFRAHTENSLRSRPYLDPAAARKTFAEVAKSWMASRKKIRDSTRHRDERDLKTWVLPKWGQREIGSITRAETIAWITELEAGTAPHEYAARVAGKVAAGLSPRSIRGLYIILNGALNHSVDLRWLAYNEAQGIELAATEENRRVYLNFAQVEALASRVGRYSGRASDETLIRLLAYTGLRIGEALALKVSDVDMLKHRVLVERTWTDSNGTIKLGPPKSGKTRRVPIHGFLAPEYQSLVEDRPGDAWLFEAPRGGNHSPNNWRARVWQKAVRGSEYQLMQLTPHGLRHTAASMAIASGADVKVVQEMLGHSSAVQTLDTYADLWPDRLDEVADKVGEARKRALEGAAENGEAAADNPAEEEAA